MAEGDTFRGWPEHAIPATHAERVASKIGTLIHKVFETYARTNKPDYLAKWKKDAFWELNLRPLQLLLWKGAHLNHESNGSEDSIRPQVYWIFDNSIVRGLRVEDEPAQNALRNNCYRPDLFDQEDTRWLIDYKTSHRQPEQTESEFIQSQTEKYRSQLENYRDLMKATENRTTRLALLLTDIPTVVEIEPN